MGRDSYLRISPVEPPRVNARWTKTCSSGTLNTSSGGITRWTVICYSASTLVIIYVARGVREHIWVIKRTRYQHTYARTQGKREHVHSRRQTQRTHNLHTYAHWHTINNDSMNTTAEQRLRNIKALPPTKAGHQPRWALEVPPTQVDSGSVPPTKVGSGDRRATPLGGLWKLCDQLCNPFSTIQPLHTEQ